MMKVIGLVLALALCGQVYGASKDLNCQTKLLSERWVQLSDAERSFAIQNVKSKLVEDVADLERVISLVDKEGRYQELKDKRALLLSLQLAADEHLQSLGRVEKGLIASGATELFDLFTAYSSGLSFFVNWMFYARNLEKAKKSKAELSEAMSEIITDVKARDKYADEAISQTPFVVADLPKSNMGMMFVDDVVDEINEQFAGDITDVLSAINLLMMGERLRVVEAGTENTKEIIEATKKAIAKLEGDLNEYLCLARGFCNR